MKIGKNQSGTMQGLADLVTAGIGESLLKKPKSSIHSKAKDIQAVCNAARRLLRLEQPTRVRGTIGLLAEDFAGVPPTTTADDLLEVRVIE